MGADENTKAVIRKQVGPLPRSRLVSITAIVAGIRERSGNRLSFDEITDALACAIDDVMMYDGSYRSLCDSINGDLRSENDGRECRREIIYELFNSKYWRSDDIGSGSIWYNGQKISVNDLMVEDVDGEAISHSLWGFFYPGEIASQQLPAPIPSSEIVSGISGQTFDRLCRAIAAFPERYPEYQSKPPKLNDDVRAWLKANYGASDREAHVFGAIISEHFKLSPDTLKTP